VKSAGHGSSYIFSVKCQPDAMYSLDASGNMHDTSNSNKHSTATATTTLGLGLRLEARLVVARSTSSGNAATADVREECGGSTTSTSRRYTIHVAGFKKVGCDTERGSAVKAGAVLLRVGGQVVEHNTEAGLEAAQKMLATAPSPCMLVFRNPEW
jgi:hypothetical protein